MKETHPSDKLPGCRSANFDTKDKEENRHTFLPADMSAIQVIFGGRNAQPIPPGNLRFDDLDGLVT